MPLPTLPPINITTPKSDSTVKIVALVVGGGLVWFKGIKPYLDKVKQGNELKFQQAQTITATKDKKLYTILGKPILNANLATIATDIYNGLHPGWYKPTDQDRVVRAFQNTPYGYVNQLEEVYLKTYGENLRTTMADKLSDANWIKIKFNFK